MDVAEHDGGAVKQPPSARWLLVNNPEQIHLGLFLLNGGCVITPPTTTTPLLLQPPSDSRQPARGPDGSPGGLSLMIQPCVSTVIGISRGVRAAFPLSVLLNARAPDVTGSLFFSAGVPQCNAPLSP